MTKQQLLLQLARQRQQHVPEGYLAIGDYHQGAYECDYVSPYTKSAHNLDAHIMVILQDWCSHEYLSKPLNPDLINLGLDPKLPTSRHLEKLLQTYFGLSLADTYGTNLFPFIKPGSLSTTIPRRQLIQAARDFSLPLITIIQPRLVICLGLGVYNAIAVASDHAAAKTLDAAITSPFEIQETVVYAQAHTGGQGRASRNRGGVDCVNEDWAAMAKTTRPMLKTS